MNTENWGTWEEAIEACIIDYFLQNLSSVEFKQEEIVNEYGVQLQEWHPVKTLRASVSPQLRKLMKNKQLKELGEGRYKLIEKECLYRKVQLERCRRQLQNVADILDTLYEQIDT